MKNIFILLISIVLFNQTIIAQAQLNKITDVEYAEIKINNISILTILNTHGDHSQLKSLFGNDLLYEEYDLPTVGRNSWNANISLHFQDEDYSLNYMSIRNYTTVTIKGNTVRIGDNFSKLGNVLINTNEGDYSVIFIDEKTHTASLGFKLDPTSNIITNITYNLF